MNYWTKSNLDVRIRYGVRNVRLIPFLQNGKALVRWEARWGAREDDGAAIWIRDSLQFVTTEEAQEAVHYLRRHVPDE
jgi:hypothetical protein